MKLITTLSSLIFLTSVAATPMQAMPTAPAQQAVSGAVTLVAQGCGPGYHRGPYGACRPLFSCPPGWHSGPFGRRCFRNW